MLMTNFSIFSVLADFLCEQEAKISKIKKSRETNFNDKKRRVYTTIEA